MLRKTSGAPGLRALLLIGALVALPSCDEVSPGTVARDAAAREDVGFQATITGAYDGTVSGDGVLVLLPQAGADKQGYFFLADGQGIRPHGVTFVLPRGLPPGRHALASPSPLEIGTVPSVRVDRDRGDSVQSAEANTIGFLDLTAFPADEGQMTGATVAGSFNFQTEDRSGERVMVTGEFSFQVE